MISGPPTALYRQATTAKILFGENGQELNCYFNPALPTPICPVPLFHPESAGMLNVTFTVTHRNGVCTFNGQYRVGKQKTQSVDNVLSLHYSLFRNFYDYSVISD